MKTNFPINFPFRFDVLWLIILVLSNEILLFCNGFAETKFCTSTKENACVILCRNWDLESPSEELNKILRKEEKNFNACTLILEGCTNGNTTWKLILNDKPKIEELKIVHSSIDLNQVNLNIFKNLHSLTIENTTTGCLRLETFYQLPELRKLNIKTGNLIKWVEQGFIQNLTLEHVQIFHLTSNRITTVQFLKNLTGGHEIPEIYALDSFQNSSLVSCDFQLKFKGIRGKNRRYLTKYKVSCGNPSKKKYREFISQNCPLEKHSGVVGKHNPQTNAIKFLPGVNEPYQKFTLANDEPELLDVTILDPIDLTKVFFWYWNYANATSPQFNCSKIPREKFKLQVTPNTGYLLCLARISQSEIEIFSCLPFKTKLPYREQPWLTNESIPFSIIFISVVFVFALATGALILYLLVRKNPSLIRGSKRVIEVKTHDKAQVLIMPRGYESPSQQPEATPLVLANPRLKPSFSCDTVSTVSYVSAHQPTQLEIFNYRLTRLRELFQRNNNLPPAIPMQVVTPGIRRLPPHVDLLLEYEWYTITTTTQG